MKKSIFPGILTFAAIILALSATQAQKVGVYDCKWHNATASEDEEGLINQMQFEEKSNFLFLFSNDEKSLFVDLVIADKGAIQKVMRFGLTTWFNPEGKHKKVMGIQFPVPPEEDNESDFKREKGGDRKEMMLAMMDLKNQEMVLVGFGAKDERKSIDPRIDSSFHGKVNMMEGGNMHISLEIPLNKLDRSKETVSLPISAGFETGYLDLNREGMTAGGGGGDSHGGGEMHGGGYPGGGPPGGGTGSQGQSASQQQQKQPDISELASPTKLWVSQVKLAVK
jgi:hypothetical protein